MQSQCSSTLPKSTRKIPSVRSAFGARIGGLEWIGFVIRSEQREGEKYVRHVSESEPPEPKPLPGNADWYERIAGKPSARETDDLPLFAGERA